MHERGVHAVVEEGVLDWRVFTTTGAWRHQHQQVEDQAGRDGTGQLVHPSVHSTPAEHEAGQPLRRGQQHAAAARPA